MIKFWFKAIGPGPMLDSDEHSFRVDQRVIDGENDRSWDLVRVFTVFSQENAIRTYSRFGASPRR